MPNAPTGAPPPDLLTPSEAASMFRVHPKTLSRWAQQGKLAATRLPGGQRRYRRADIEAIINAGSQS